MRLQIMSDLHLGYPGSRGAPPPVRGIDAVVVAGDTCEGLFHAVEALGRAYPEPLEIVAVPGNHEFNSRHATYREELAAGREAAAALRVGLLENAVCFLGRLRVIGCTMWTDYGAFGESLRPAAMRAAAGYLLDHRRIKWSRSPWRRFRPEEARTLHLKSREFVIRELGKLHAGPTVCIFHHGVVLDAVAPVFRGEVETAAYASRLERLIDLYQPDLVVSGHTHHSMDIRRGRTRLVSDPAGYGDENPLFDPAFVVEIPDA